MHLPKLIFRNIFRHKPRTGLTVLGIVVAILSFGLLSTVVDAWYAGANASSDARLITRKPEGRKSVAYVQVLPPETYSDEWLR